MKTLTSVKSYGLAFLFSSTLKVRISNSKMFLPPIHGKKNTGKFLLSVEKHLRSLDAKAGSEVFACLGFLDHQATVVLITAGQALRCLN